MHVHELWAVEVLEQVKTDYLFFIVIRWDINGTDCS